ncbi:MAG TPA: DNA alkylation repair protein [Chitinophagaceae bacterium]|nr:DNA alkylation repair protein [Chitinophagaceae bacterium]
MSQQLKIIQKELQANSIPEAKAAHKKFVPTEERIYGVRMPVLNEMAGKYKSGGFELVEELWKAGMLEERALAVKIMGKIAKKDPERALQLTQLFAKNIGNWAICDAMGMQGLKPILTSHQKEIFALAWKYNRSKDPWQRRLSLVLVEWYTRIPALQPEIKKLVKNLEHDDEYYVKKAIVWIKKNLNKGK